MAEIKNSESDMSTQQKAELDKEKRKEETKRPINMSQLLPTKWKDGEIMW